MGLPWGQATPPGLAGLPARVDSPRVRHPHQHLLNLPQENQWTRKTGLWAQCPLEEPHLLRVS